MVAIEESQIRNKYRIDFERLGVVIPISGGWRQEVLTSIFTAQPLCVYEAELAIFSNGVRYSSSSSVIHSEKQR